jgi:shikimate dehydrogenase
MDEVDYISGRTRIYGIVGHPIEQVRSPEMFTASFKSRAADAIMLPFHVLPDDFDRTVPALMSMPNLGGLIFTIPYKQKALLLADEIGSNAKIVGAINALARKKSGGWKAEIFDGIGCVQAFRNRGFSFAGKRIMLMGAGGAGSAIGVAVAHESPLSIHLYDPDVDRALDLIRKIQLVDPSIQVERTEPNCQGIDILMNASPVGMLDDQRSPIILDHQVSELIVFDAIVKPEKTPLLCQAEALGCLTVRGREMMLGQIKTMTDFFGF